MKKAVIDYKYVIVNGIKTIMLSYEKEHSLAMYIAPERGANMVRFCADGYNIIDFEASVFETHGFTGTPVLYPTPNRVRDGRFVFEGSVFEYESPDWPAYEHGLLHDQIWNAEKPVILDDSISIELSYSFTPESKRYNAFPIAHKITLKYSLDENGVKMEYHIENHDEKRLPYGFALHPYFIKLSGDEGTHIKLPAKKCMEATKELLPTGRLIDAKELNEDVTDGEKLANMDLDHVFTDINKGGYCRIWYDNVPFDVLLKAGDTFSHIVCYTPPGEEFFCIENQTCSTDAHNMYDKGFISESGLEIIEPGGKAHDYIEYRVEFK